MKKAELTKLIEKYGQRYPTLLGINVDTGDSKEVFKWFLASLLFGAPITESSAIKTYKTFEKHKGLTPKEIIQTGWNGLVKILDEGTYTRYDYKTADKLLLVMRNLNEKYQGNLNGLHQEAQDKEDLEKKLKELGKGIGNVTISIFLRELRSIWSKADPTPTPLVIQAAKNLKITKTEDAEKALSDLKSFWKRNEIKGKSFVNLETALLRYAKELRTKKSS